MRDLLVLLAKQPRPGQVKTRLGLPGAAMLYEAFLRDLVDRFCDCPEWDLAVALTPPEARDWFAALWPRLMVQRPGDLAARLEGVFADAFADGRRRVVVLATDSPDLPVAHVREAFGALRLRDMVLGPCEDGGYYLIGIGLAASAGPPSVAVGPPAAFAVFRDIAWSTAEVMRQTLARAAEASVSVALLPSWYDVDGPDDLRRLAGAPGLAETLPRTAAQLRAEGVPARS